MAQNGDNIVGEPREWALCGILQQENGRAKPNQNVWYSYKSGGEREEKVRIRRRLLPNNNKKKLFYTRGKIPLPHTSTALNTSTPTFPPQPFPSFIFTHSTFRFLSTLTPFFTSHSTPPNTHCNNVVVSDTWLLPANSARKRKSSQSSWRYAMYAHRCCSTTVFTLSVCLSVCGWKAVESHASIFSDEHRCFQKREVNCGPLY